MDQESDDEFDQAKLTDEHAKRILHDEVIFLFNYFFLLICLLQLPKDVSVLFNDDFDVEFANTRSHFSASSGVSRPATSESEGLLDRHHLEDEDGNEEHSDVKYKASASKRTQKHDDKVCLPLQRYFSN